MTWLCSDAWAAGFFDGEGCVSIHRRVRRNSVSFIMTAQVTQNDRRPLDALAEIFGGTVSRPRKEGVDRCHRWRVHSRQAERFLLAILPYLLVKRAPTELALAVQAASAPIGARHSAQSNQIREEAYAAFCAWERP
jgi:hypothetical protein